jgi:hypothetical protein
MDYSLQAPAKKVEGAQHPDRDGQFRYINRVAQESREASEPVVSIDCKKKELVGQKANGVGSTSPKAPPSGSTSTTSPTPRWERPYPSASMT